MVETGSFSFSYTDHSPLRVVYDTICTVKHRPPVGLIKQNSCGRLDIARHIIDLNFGYNI